jgi:hypothetical protein
LSCILRRRRQADGARAFRLIAGGLAARGLADRESINAELQDLVSYTADPDSVMSLPHIFQVAARLP